MEINKAFPILDSIENNVLTNNIFNVLYNSGYTNDGIADIKKSFPVFLNTPLKIDYISQELHDLLLKTSNFFKARVMLQNSDELTGLLLLPDTIYSDFSNVPDYVDVDTTDYPINTILYAWSSFDNLDKRLGIFDEEWGDDSDCARGKQKILMI